MRPNGPILALDTATDTAHLGVVDRDGYELLGALEAPPVALLACADELLAATGLTPVDLSGIVVGVGPGRYTSLRIGLASAAGMAAALEIPIAGVSTLEALAARAPGAVAMIDARRRQVFALEPARPDAEPICAAPGEVAVEGKACVGDGAIAYREELEARGARVPPDDDPRHCPSTPALVELATFSDTAAAPQPMYLRSPDAERTRKEFPRA